MPTRKPKPSAQQNLFTAPPPAQQIQLPEHARFPHNEAGHRVRKAVAADIATGDVLLVVGYASIDEIIRLLAQRSETPNGTVRLLVGNEPFESRVDRSKPLARELPAQVRDYWLSRGISVLFCVDVLRALELLRSGRVEVKIASVQKPVHAKLFVGETAATLGSSNFTRAGLETSSEANARFEIEDEQRYAEVRLLAETLWRRGSPWLEDFTTLLEQLLTAVTWQEALGRACAELLEGEWAKRYIPPAELRGLCPPLWPHQLQGLSQALWILQNYGAVLVADATGSGKTRLGSWLLRAAYDRLMRHGYSRAAQPVLITPPGVRESWRKGLEEARLRWRIESSGILSSAQSGDHQQLLAAVAETELLALDEAHNYLNSGSKRSGRILSHYADQVILFTATPINRSANDLLSMVEILGADNFPDEVLDSLERLSLPGRRALPADRTEIEVLRSQIRRFMVRRTRFELNAIADTHQAAYQRAGSRPSRYPSHEAQFYEMPLNDADRSIAEEILKITDDLQGLAFIPETLELSAAHYLAGYTEARHLAKALHSAAGLVRHKVLDTLRSSRLALYEHIYGTEAMRRLVGEELAQLVKLKKKHGSGDIISTLRKKIGKPPMWGYQELSRDIAPEWLVSEDAHRLACEAEIARYERIAELSQQLSDQREQAKADHLAALYGQGHKVLAFDGYLVTIYLLEEKLRAQGVAVDTYTGADGNRGKRAAVEHLGLEAIDSPPRVALCTDAFSEGLNLQGASQVVHLNTPTVLRLAEQRAGRVDRMDSPYDTINIWWPNENGPFVPRKKDLLRVRHDLAGNLIGSNLVLPDGDSDEPMSDDVVDIKKFAADANMEKAEDPQEFFDAFRSVRELVHGPTALVPSDVYTSVRDSQARVVACISLVRSEKPWAFFAVGGLNRVAPRWVYFDRPGGKPEVDIGQVAERLREHLEVAREPAPYNASATECLTGFVNTLVERQRDLLPVRRQRALNTADQCLSAWRLDSLKRGEVDAVKIYQALRDCLEQSQQDEPHADLAEVANRWLSLIRRCQGEEETRQKRRKGLRTRWFRTIAQFLSSNPVPLEELEETFDELPTIQPITRRVVAAIVGVPG